jgi:hypothetical protein
MGWRWVRSLLLAGASLASAGTVALAEEAGSGHYLPGTTADFLDILPADPGFAYANFPVYYHGSTSASKPLEIGGKITTNVSATIYGDTSLLLYQSPWELLGGKYATGIAIPYLSVNVKGNLQLGPLSPTVRDGANDIGDIEFFPVMLVWTEGDLKWGANFGVYAPTGSFIVGDLANTGKNFWTFEPAVNISYLSKTTGFEVTGFAGFDFNTINPATNYQSGTQFHLEATVAQHLPVLGGIAGIGANAFFYQQISADSGSGAQLGSFEGRTAGIGPVLSFVYPLGKVNLAAEAKWLPEIETEHRLKGDVVWVKLAVNVPF